MNNKEKYFLAKAASATEEEPDIEPGWVPGQGWGPGYRIGTDIPAGGDPAGLPAGGRYLATGKPAPIEPFKPFVPGSFEGWDPYGGNYGGTPEEVGPNPPGTSAWEPGYPKGPSPNTRPLANFFPEQKGLPYSPEYSASETQDAVLAKHKAKADKLIGRTEALTKSMAGTAEYLEGLNKKLDRMSYEQGRDQTKRWGDIIRQAGPKASLHPSLWKSTVASRNEALGREKNNPYFKDTILPNETPQEKQQRLDDEYFQRMQWQETLDNASDTRGRALLRLQLMQDTDPAHWAKIKGTPVKLGKNFLNPDEKPMTHEDYFNWLNTTDRE